MENEPISNQDKEIRPPKAGDIIIIEKDVPYHSITLPKGTKGKLIRPSIFAPGQPDVWDVEFENEDPTKPSILMPFTVHGIDPSIQEEEPKSP